jgi:predicted negative regulator of RcsB-dependent stress response
MNRTKMGIDLVVGIVCLGFVLCGANVTLAQDNRANGSQPIVNSPQPGTALKNFNIIKKSSKALETPPPATTKYPILAVRAGEHGKYDRLVFDWNKPTKYRIQRVDDRVIIRFDRPAKADLSSLKFMELPYQAGVVDIGDRDGFALQIDVPAGAKIKDNRLDNKVFLDIIHNGRSSPSKPTARALAMNKIKLSPPIQLAAETDNNSPRQPVTGLKKPVKSEVPVPDLPVDRQTDGNPAFDFNKEIEKASKKAEQVPEINLADRQNIKAQAERMKVDPNTITSIRLDPGRAAASVIFVRGGYLWMVVNVPDLKSPPLVTGPMVERLRVIDQYPLKGGTAFRMPMMLGQYPSVSLDGQVWQVDLSSTIIPGPSAAIDISTDDEGRKSLNVNIIGAHDAINLTDPEVGDNLLLVPTDRPGDSVRESRRLPQFEFLPSIQGVVVRSLVDELEFKPTKDTLYISTVDGLLLSADRRALLDATPESSVEGAANRLFDLQRWQRGSEKDFDKNRRALQNQIADLPRSNDQIIPILDLARLHFAHDFAPETTGLIEVAAGLDSEIVNKPEILALRGAARALYGDGVGAIQDLSIAAIANHPEAALWRGVAFARQGLWNRAADEFGKSEKIISSYPDDLFDSIVGLNVEALLFINQPDAALKLVDEWQDRGKKSRVNQDAIDYLRGDIMIRKGEKETGLELWHKVEDAGRDRLYTVKAAFGLIDYGLSTNQMPPKEAIDKLDGLRFAWRGDTLELAILRRLGNLQIQEKDYRNGFELLQRAVGYFPGSSQSELLTKDMAKAFNALFVEDESAKLSPIEAYGIYDQFRDLTPIGPEGDKIVEKLTNRLVQADLLTEASNLLQYQVEFRLEGSERARIGTHLAGIRLLDLKAKQALQVLDLTDKDVTEPAMRAERLLLRAKAIDMDGDPDQALALLGIERSPQSDRLRVDIAWRAAKWAAAAQALDRLIGDPPPVGQTVSPEIGKMVLNRAVALSLGGNSDGLKILRDRFSAAMELSPLADGFNLLVRPETDALTDMGRIRKQIQEVDLFGNFLSGYKATTTTPPQ